MRDNSTKLLEEAYNRVIEERHLSQIQQEDTKTRQLHLPGFIGRPKIFTPEQQQEIIRRYKDGEPALRIAKDFNTTPPTIAKFLAKSGIQIRGIGREWTPEQIKDIAKLYKQGASPTTIAKKYNVSATSINRVLAVDTDVELRTHRNPTVRQDISPDIDPDEIDKKRYGYEYTTGVPGYDPDTIYMQSPSGEVEEVNSLDTDTLDTLEMQGWTQIYPKRSTSDKSDNYA